MNEVKIQIPDNCELIKDGDTYIVKEKKQILPKSWKEFCKRFPIREEEAYILVSTNGIFIAGAKYSGVQRVNKSWCTSEEEAEAFLALMQLRQLRKAWVRDWEVPTKGNYGVIYPQGDNLITAVNDISRRVLSFPTKEMAEDFLRCFRDLCETAKPLL